MRPEPGAGPRSAAPKAPAARPAPARATPKPPAVPAPTPAPEEPGDFDAILALASEAANDFVDPMPPAPPPSPAEQPFSVPPPAPPPPPNLAQRLGQANPELVSIVTRVALLLGLCLSMEVVFYWQSAFANGFFFAFLDGLLLLFIGAVTALAAGIKRGFRWRYLKGPALLSGCGALVLCTSVLFLNASGIIDAFNPPTNAHNRTMPRPY
jgi:hypothetical protein